MFEGDHADMHGGKFLLVSMGVEQGVERVQTREQRTPSALEEILHMLLSHKIL